MRLAFLIGVVFIWTMPFSKVKSNLDKTTLKMPSSM